MLKKQDKWLEAIKFWEIAAGKNDLDSCIELAKYFEHREIDLQNALHWVDLAIQVVVESDASGKRLYELEHRKSRLESKINSNHEK